MNDQMQETKEQNILFLAKLYCIQSSYNSMSGIAFGMNIDNLETLELMRERHKETNEQILELMKYFQEVGNVER